MTPIQRRYPRVIRVRSWNQPSRVPPGPAGRTAPARATLEAVPAPAHADEALARAVHRRDQPAADRELILQRRRHPLPRRRRDVDGVKRRLLGQPQRPVANYERHVVDAGRRQGGARVGGELRVALDAPDVRGQAAEQRSVVAGAGAHVEHAVGGRELEQLAHARDHERLRDRLAGGEWQRRVLPRVTAQVGRHEEVTRYRRHGLQHARVIDRGAQDPQQSLPRGHGRDSDDLRAAPELGSVNDGRFPRGHARIRRARNRPRRQHVPGRAVPRRAAAGRDPRHPAHDRGRERRGTRARAGRGGHQRLARRDRRRDRARRRGGRRRAGGMDRRPALGQRGRRGRAALRPRGAPGHTRRRRRRDHGAGPHRPRRLRQRSRRAGDGLLVARGAAADAAGAAARPLRDHRPRRPPLLP